MEASKDNQKPDDQKGIISGSGLELLLNNLPGYATSEQEKERFQGTANYIKAIYLRLIDAAYTSKKGEADITRLIGGLVKGDPKAISELCDLRYRAVMARNRVGSRKNVLPQQTQEEIAKLLNAKATLVYINVKQKASVPESIVRAFQTTPGSTLNPQNKA